MVLDFTNLSLLLSFEGAVLCRFSPVRLCDLMGCSPPGSSVHGILQERILEWVVVRPPGDLPNPGSQPHCWQILYS